MLRWPECRLILEGDNRQNALHQFYRACTFRMGITYRTCPREGRLTKILCPLHKAERRDFQECLPNSMNGRLFGPSRRSTYVLNVRCHFWRLTKSKKTTKPGEYDIYMTPRTVDTFKNAFRSEGHTELVPTHDVHYTVDSQVAVWALIPRRWGHPLQVSRKVLELPTDAVRTTVESQRMIYRK